MPASTRPLELSDEEIASLPADRLALTILNQFSEDGWQVHLYNYLNAWRNAGVDPADPKMRALTEACEWLQQKHPGISNGFISRLGLQVVNSGLPFLSAVKKLISDLHPSIASVSSQFLLGEFDLEAFAAMKQMKVRVRDGQLSGRGHRVQADAKFFRPNPRSAS